MHKAFWKKVSDIDSWPFCLLVAVVVIVVLACLVAFRIGVEKQGRLPGGMGASPEQRAVAAERGWPL